MLVGRDLKNTNGLPVQSDTSDQRESRVLVRVNAHSYERLRIMRNIS